jgi:hypothetical protein
MTLGQTMAWENDEFNQTFSWYEQLNHETTKQQNLGYKTILF